MIDSGQLDKRGPVSKTTGNESALDTPRNFLISKLGVAIDPTCVNIGRLERTLPIYCIMNGR